MDGYSEWMVIPSGWLFRGDGYSEGGGGGEKCLEGSKSSQGLIKEGCFGGRFGVHVQNPRKG